MTSKLAISLLLLLTPAAGFSQNANPAPHRYLLRKKVSASEAERDFKETIRKVWTIYGSSNSRAMCPSADGKLRACITAAAGSEVYVDEYVTSTSNRATIVPSRQGMQGGLAEQRWVPLNRVARGQERLKALEEMLAKKEPTDCDDETGECKIIVEAVPVSKEERVLAACNVAMIGNEWGAVTGCEAVAIITSKESYIKAIVGYLRGGSVVEVSAGSDLEFHVQSSPGDTFLPTVDNALSAAQDVLSHAPLSLRTELRPRGNPVRVVGIAGVRVSPVLPGTWWEKVTITIIVDRDEGEGASLALSVSFELWLNKQNTERREDFRPPSEAQLNGYKGCTIRLD